MMVWTRHISHTAIINFNKKNFVSLCTSPDKIQVTWLSIISGHLTQVSGDNTLGEMTFRQLDRLPSVHHQAQLQTNSNNIYLLSIIQSHIYIYKLNFTQAQFLKKILFTALEQKRFDIRSLSPTLRNLWLLLVVTAYPHIHFDIHLRQHKKDTVWLFVVLKATEGRKAQKKGITAYPHIQLFLQGYSFEVAGYSVITPLFVVLKSLKTPK